MRNRKKGILVVSIFGNKSAGGVERVTFFLEKVLSKEYEVKLLSGNLSFGKYDIVLYPFFFFVKLLLCRRYLVISNGWQCWMKSVDYLICHGTTQGIINHMPELASFGSGYISFMERIAMRNAKKILAVSNHCQRELIELYRVSPDKITVLNNFVDCSLFTPDIVKEETKGLVFIFSGRICARKGMYELLALANYIESHKVYELKIACNDLENAEIFSGLEKTAVISGLSLHEMGNFYNSGDVMYFPSHYEGFSMAALEALACGIPVIGSKFAIAEELREYDFTYVTNGERPEEIVKIGTYLKEKYSLKKDNIHTVIEHNFGYEQYKNKLLEIIGGSVDKKSNK